MPSVAKTKNGGCTKPTLGNQFPAYIAGRLSAPVRGNVERHVRNCLSCRTELCHLLQIRAALERRNV